MATVPTRRRARAAAALTLAALFAQAPAPAAAKLPPENQCPTLSGLPGGGKAQDAAPVRLKEGMQLGYDDMLLLGSLLPVEVWRNRDSFFHDGMRLEIGPCHRRYPVPEFFRNATRRFAGRARVDRDGNLLGHQAGLPFDPDRIEPRAGDAGIQWAWDFERRYRGAGPIGEFRLVDMPSRLGGIQTYEGEWFFLQTGARADLPKSDYQLPEAAGAAWITGGRFTEPHSARHLAWRQIRPLETADDYELPDDTFVYVPTMRKVRRAGTAWVDGVYMPRYRVGGDAGGGGLPVGGDLGGAINPSAGESIAVTEDLRRGFTGLAVRPNAYVWRVLDEREVLAPINVTRTGWPESKQRNYGPSGLSVGSDRWDVRWAVVLQGALRERGRDYDLVTLYVDYQTQQPLYYVSKRRRGGLLVEVGVLMHRFSGDVPHYPTWPSGEKANVFDPVAAVFFEAGDGGSGWRREAYGIRSVPLPEDEVHRLTSPGFLTRGR